MHDQAIGRLEKTHDESRQLLKELLEEKEIEKRRMLEKFHLMCHAQFGRTLPFEDERLQNQVSLNFITITCVKLISQPTPSNPLTLD